MAQGKHVGKKEYEKSLALIICPWERQKRRAGSLRRAVLRRLTTSRKGVGQSKSTAEKKKEGTLTTGAPEEVFIGGLKKIGKKPSTPQEEETNEKHQITCSIT